MRAVNLLPADRRTAKRSSDGLDASQRKLLLIGGAVGALLVVGLCFLVVTSSSSVSDKRKRLDALQSQIATTPTAESLQAGLGTRASTVTTLVAKRLHWDEFLGTLSKVMPEDVWLQNLQTTTPGAAATLAAQQAAAAASAAAASASQSGKSGTTTTAATPPPAPAASTTPSSFTVTGWTYSQPSVARMMRRLDLVPWLTGVTLVSSTKSTVGADTVFQFTVKATIVTPEAAS